MANHTRVSPSVLDWLAKLVAIDSTSRESNLPVIDLVAGHARSLGLTPQVYPSSGGDRANLLVTVPAASGSTAGGVLLSGHTDCVPVDGQTWASDPFVATERDGLVYGRGTADMKGFVAVMVDAMARASDAKLAEPLHFGFTHDEEIGCVGAPALVASLAESGISPRAGFVGEPSSMRMIRGHKSMNVIEIGVKGLAAHSSLTAHGVNAVEYAAEIVRYWRGRADRWRDEGPYDDAYPIRYTTASVNMISGGTAPNIVPQDCTLALEFRAIAETDDAAEIEALKEYCAGVEQRMRAEHDEASVSVHVVGSAVGLDTSEDSPVVALGQELGLAVGGDKVTYGTEAGIFSDAGIACVVCGPGDIAQAHKPDEFVSLEQLGECEAFVGRLLAHLTAD